MPSHDRHSKLVKKFQNMEYLNKQCYGYVSGISVKLEKAIRTETENNTKVCKWEMEVKLQKKKSVNQHLPHPWCSEHQADFHQFSLEAYDSAEKKSRSSQKEDNVSDN